MDDAAELGALGGAVPRAGSRGGRARLAGGEAARVNSSHHQAIKGVGRDLRVTARAGDGVIEAVEDSRPDRFCLGVQWHPEQDAADRRLFAALVAAAQDGQGSLSVSAEPWSARDAASPAWGGAEAARA